ncbi:MAG: hypothetical protein ACW99U_19085 [Candidatus Thorarchaeota archaeon]|jgi:hypothetical protein
MKLSREAYDRACEFVHKSARPLDTTLFEYYFENGSKESVIKELSAYQNADGGFGHGIEPDIRLRASSPMATSVGLQYCMELEVDDGDPIVASAIEYLVSTYNFDSSYWPQTFMDVNEEPHAPWWNLEKIETPEEAKWPNPSAELAGYLHRYSTHASDDFMMNVNRRILANLDSSDRIEGLYNIMCWQRALVSLPEPAKSKAYAKQVKTFRELGPLSPSDLGEIRIFWLAPRMESYLTLNRPGNVYWLYDHEIERQSEDGGWWPTWKWGQYEDVWPVAEKEWAGKMTVECLRSLNDFKLIKDE